MRFARFWVRDTNLPNPSWQISSKKDTQTKMALLPEETLDTVFILQRQLIERINQTTSTAFTIFEQFGETSETMPELKELDNIREKLTSSYSRLSTLLLSSAQYQPIAPTATLNLLEEGIEQGQAMSEAALANIREIRSNWNL